MQPKPLKGLRHIALNVKLLEACITFYKDMLGMKIVWQPDNDNYYLSFGDDNLALHRAPFDFHPGRDQHLDHLGFFLDSPEEVDRWHDYLAECGIKISAKPKTHRDGSRSCYVLDPDGNLVQLIYIPK